MSRPRFHAERVAPKYTMAEFLRDTGHTPDHYIGDADVARIASSILYADEAEGEVCLLEKEVAELHSALWALVAGLEDAGPVHCGHCVNRHTGNTGDPSCSHADELSRRIGRARTVLGQAT